MKHNTKEHTKEHKRERKREHNKKEHKKDRTHKRDHRQEKTGDQNDENLIDNSYSALLTDNCSCFVSFSGDSQMKSYAMPLIVKRDKRMISWRDDMGAWRYSSTDYLIYNPDYNYPSFRFKQEKEGECFFYQCNPNDENFGTLICETLKSEFRPIDPMLAFIMDDFLYVVFNRPTEEALDRGLLSRLPVENNDIVKASGMLLISQIDLHTGEHHVLFFTKKSMFNYFASLITEPNTLLPGLLLFHPLNDDKQEMTGPSSFAEFSEYVTTYEVDKNAKEFSVPIGISVFDFDTYNFDKIALTGNEKWGIEKVDIAEQPNSDRITFGIMEVKQQKSSYNNGNTNVMYQEEIIDEIKGRDIIHETRDDIIYTTSQS